MPDKTITPDKLRQDIIKTLKEAITSYEGTVKEIRQRELKKTELCLLCGNADGPTTCTCLRKDDMAAMDTANGIGGGGPMAMSEDLSGNRLSGLTSVADAASKHAIAKQTPQAYSDASAKHNFAGDAHKARANAIVAASPKGVGVGADAFRHHSEKAKYHYERAKIHDSSALGKDELHEADGPTVQGARAVPDKKEPGAVLPGDKPSKDDQPDEGSGGMKKGELGGGMPTTKPGKTVADIRARANHGVKAVAVEGPAAPTVNTSTIPMGKGEKMDTQTGGRLSAIAGDRMKDIINAPKTKGSLRPKLSGMGKMVKSMVPSVQAKVNEVVGNQDPGDVPQNVKDALKPDEKKDKKDKDGKKKPVEGSKDNKPMAKVSVAEANKEMSGFKSVAGKPMPGMGTKVANPQAMSPGKGPKPVAGSITAKNEDRLAEVLGKCGLCGKQEHKKCEI